MGTNKFKENYLLFTNKQQSCQPYTVTATNIETDWNGADEDQTINLETLKWQYDLTTYTLDLQNISEVLITSAADVAGSTRGSGYINASPNAGEVTKMLTGGYAVSGTRNAVLTIDKINGDNADAANGYNLGLGDIVQVNMMPIAGGAVVYRASNYLGATATAAATTTLHFKAKVGTGDADDTITLTHTSGAFNTICDIMTRCVEATPHTKGECIHIADFYNGIFGGDPAYNEAGITNCVIAFDS